MISIHTNSETVPATTSVVFYYGQIDGFDDTITNASSGFVVIVKKILQIGIVDGKHGKKRVFGLFEEVVLYNAHSCFLTVYLKKLEKY